MVVHQMKTCNMREGQQRATTELLWPLSFPYIWVETSPKSVGNDPVFGLVGKNKRGEMEWNMTEIYGQIAIGFSFLGLSQRALTQT